MALQRLKESAETAKKELSASKQTDINLPFITAGLNDNKLSKIRNEKIGFVFQSYHLLPEFTAVQMPDHLQLIIMLWIWIFICV